MIKLLTLIILVHRSCAGHELEITFSQKSLDKFSEVFLHVFNDLKKGKIPNNDGSITNIEIINFKPPSAKMSFIENKGVLLSLKDLLLIVTCNWSYDTWLVTFGGTAKMDCKSNFDFSVQLGIDKNGYPTIRPDSCSIVMSKFELTIGGSYLSFIFNILVSLFENKIKTMIGNDICATARRVVEKNASLEFKSFNKEPRIHDYMTIDYSLVKMPYIRSSYIRTFLRGTFKEDDVVKKSPVMLAPTDNMVGFSISENLFNSALRIIYKAGEMSYHLNGNEINHKCEVNITDDYYVKVHAKDVPKSDILKSGLEIRLPGIIEFISTETFQPILVVDVNLIVLTKDIFLRKFSLYGSLNDIEVIITNMSPSDVSTTVMPTCVQAIIEKVLELVNDQLSDGLPLPRIRWLSFEKTVFDFHERYITASTDIRLDW